MSRSAPDHAPSGPAGHDRADIDRELAHLPPDLRWREWMGRVEAVLFASATPVPRDRLHGLVGRSVSLDLLIGDIRAELTHRPYDLVEVAGGWMLRTLPRFAEVIRAAGGSGDAAPGFSEREIEVLCAIAYHQPIDRAGLAGIFGRQISRDLLGRLQRRNLIAAGPRSPRPGAPHTFVTTQTFLTVFDLRSLRDLPDPEGAGAV